MMLQFLYSPLPITIYSFMADLLLFSPVSIRVTLSLLLSTIYSYICLL